MAGSHLQILVEQRGYSKEFWLERDEDDEPIPTTEKWFSPCVTHVTITYTGDDPEGVAQWDICQPHEGMPTPGFGSTLVGGSGVKYPGVGKCRKGFDFEPGPDDVLVKDKDLYTYATNDFSSGIQILEEDELHIKLRCLSGYPKNPSTIDGGSDFDSVPNPIWPFGEISQGFGGSLGILHVNAITHSDGRERTTVFAGCPELKLLKDNGRAFHASKVDCTGTALWKVIGKVDAGPFAFGDTPSDAGCMLTIRFRQCVHTDPPDFYGDGPLTGNWQRDWQPGDDCCTDTPSDQAEWDAFLLQFWESWPGEAVISSGGGGSVSEVRPPRDEPEWDPVLRNPILQQRWPVLNEFGLIDFAATMAHPTYGPAGTSPGIYGADTYYTVFLGTCSRYLVLNQPHTWNFAVEHSNSLAAVPLQVNAMLHGTTDVDVSMDTESGEDSDPKFNKARAAGVHPVLTKAGCCECCGGCVEGMPVNYVRYKPTESTGWIECTDQTFNYDGGGPYETPTHYEYRVWEIDWDNSTINGTPLWFAPVDVSNSDGPIIACPDFLVVNYIQRTGLRTTAQLSYPGARIAGYNSTGGSYFVDGSSDLGNCSTSTGFVNIEDWINVAVNQTWPYPETVRYSSTPIYFDHCDYDGVDYPCNGDAVAISSNKKHHITDISVWPLTDQDTVQYLESSPPACEAAYNAASPCNAEDVCGGYHFYQDNWSEPDDPPECFSWWSALTPGVATVQALDGTIYPGDPGYVVSETNYNYWGFLESHLNQQVVTEYDPSHLPCYVGDPAPASQSELRSCVDAEFVHVEWPVSVCRPDLPYLSACVPASLLGAPPNTLRIYTGARKTYILNGFADPPEVVLYEDERDEDDLTVGMAVITSCRFANGDDFVGFSEYYRGNYSGAIRVTNDPEEGYCD